MLKIKDDIDLKELEKFGFVENSKLNYEYIRENEQGRLYRIYITKNHHNIQIETFDRVFIAQRLQDILYDLIQAGLVEKVEEE